MLSYVNPLDWHSLKSIAGTLETYNGVGYL
jgi:hypothetical protein